jgi:site-specific recombinase XerD
MTRMMNIHLSFVIRRKRLNKLGESPIVLRIIYREERRDIYTGLYCKVEDWDSHYERMNSRINGSKTLNENLDLIRHNVLEDFQSLKYSGTIFTIQDLIEKIKGKEESPILLKDYLLFRKTDIKKRMLIDISRPTHEKYERVIRFTIMFLDTEKKYQTISLPQIDTLFLDKFFEYLRVERRIANNTSVKYIGALRTIIMPAILNGTIRKNPFLGFKQKIKKIHKDYLTQEELQLLMDLQIMSPDLGRIRDQFVFCCFTGLAYVDLRQLTRFNIKKDQGDTYYIEKARQKTGQQSIIPLVQPAIRILKKYSCSDDFRDFKWYVSSNSKMNKRLKEIASMAGLEKSLHMHLARHTFATTVTLSNGVPIESVSSMLGHATIRQTQDYAKVVALKVKVDMEKVNRAFL